MYNKPVFLNLLKIRLPITAILSILHRITGILLVVSMPFIIWLLAKSLQSRESFDQVSSLLSESIMTRLTLALVVWALLHHLIAGVRYLVLDAGVGFDKKSSIVSSKILLILSLIIFIILMIRAIL